MFVPITTYAVSWLILASRLPSLLPQLVNGAHAMVFRFLDLAAGKRNRFLGKFPTNADSLQSCAIEFTTSRLSPTTQFISRGNHGMRIVHGSLKIARLHRSRLRRSPRYAARFGRSTSRFNDGTRTSRLIGTTYRPTSRRSKRLITALHPTSYSSTFRMSSMDVPGTTQSRSISSHSSCYDSNILT